VAGDLSCGATEAGVLAVDLFPPADEAPDTADLLAGSPLPRKRKLEEMRELFCSLRLSCLLILAPVYAQMKPSLFKRRSYV
jgi:hypothetical protein